MTLHHALQQAGYYHGTVTKLDDLITIVPALRKRCMWRLAAWVERYVSEPCYKNWGGE